MHKKTTFSINYFLFVLFSFLILNSLLFSGYESKEISYKEFRDRISQNGIESVVITPHKIYGMMKKKKGEVNDASQSTDLQFDSKHTPWRLRFEKVRQDIERQFLVTPLNDEKLIEDLQSHGVDYRGRVDNNWFKNFFLNWIIPFGIMMLIWSLMFHRIGDGSGGGPLSIGKNKAKIYAEDPNNKVTFKEVAGIDEAVEEVKEVVDFLRQPSKFTKLGAKLPKGVLLVGPPGTGKTLLAKAVAGEAGVPFFSISGSDFVEMFVGIGAARVRDLFAQAKTKAPCIIFIDEIDSIGKSRGNGVYVGGYDERENTLNQMLTEMDGFDPRLGIIIMGATNRADVLDPALLRPGRFDRQILVDRPDLKGRKDIFGIHTKGLKLGKQVDLEKLAAQTPGFAGAEIANVCNEAALLASRRNREEITFDDFQEAIERVIAGLEKKNKLINSYERKIVAYHESGHAIVSHYTPGADPVQKVSIVPRGFGALGYTLQTPLEDRYLMSRSELIGRIKGLLGGRAAEEVVFGEISTGASNDLERSTKIARNMIEVYGMSKRLPNLSFIESKEGGYVNPYAKTKERSEKTEELIDKEMLEIISASFQEAKELLTAHRDNLDKMAETLLKKEVVTEDEILEILGPRKKEKLKV